MVTTDSQVENSGVPADDGRKGWPSLRHLLGILGPGLVTGAADDDPSGIATYSQTGAQFGYGQLWTAFWMLPLVIGVQEACGRIGNITGQGLARNIKNRYSLRTLRLLVVLLAAANVVNIGADIGAIGAGAAPCAGHCGTCAPTTPPAWWPHRSRPGSSSWSPPPCCTAPVSRTSTPRPTPRGRSSRWSRRSRTPVKSPRACSPWASSRSA